MNKIYLIIGVVVLLSGCTPLEMGRTVWGSSIRSLEEARGDGFQKTYVCRFDECFDAVLTLDRKKEAEANLKETFAVFMKDRVRSVIVAIGIFGQVDTTEVGIFFDRVEDGKYAVEISSLSTAAKEKVALLVFNKLNESFQEVLPTEYVKYEKTYTNYRNSWAGLRQ